MAKVTLDNDLYARAKQVAEAAGYSSVEEFITTLVERAVEPAEQHDRDGDVIKRMKGLGYIS